MGHQPLEQPGATGALNLHNSGAAGSLSRARTEAYMRSLAVGHRDLLNVLYAPGSADAHSSSSYSQSEGSSNARAGDD